MADFILTDAAYEAATKRGEEERAQLPIPSSASFDRTSGRVIVEFTNEAAFVFPARRLQGLENATDDEIAEVEILGETGLHWETLDVDFQISGLIAGIFGTARFMEEARRKGGMSKSLAKAAAARRNGAKGGRPRKIG